ncbi:MAG TPA: AAA family ATPase [Kofleriaceae bacterium]|nr:AAA family ATPase [Kofleriaceae bacterium]
MQPYIDQLRVRNFRCIVDVTIPLTPLHAFIGPNDSGKSTLLAALAAYPMSVGEPGSEITTGYKRNAITQFWDTDGAAGAIPHEVGVDLKEAQAGKPPPGSVVEVLAKLIRPVRVLRLDPDAMREPTYLIPQGSPIAYDDRGRGLAGVYDALLSRRLDAFLAISKELTTLFPTVRAIQLINASRDTKALSVELVNGKTVDAPRLSEGMLYWLAFAALPYLDSTALLLIEEPENGLHPSRIAEVMRVLRAVSNRTQVIVATHSPLVINELQADEVTLITRTPERGTIATPLTATKNFAQRSRVYALGELWLNYADGDLESELVADSTI